MTKSHVFIRALCLFALYRFRPAPIQPGGPQETGIAGASGAAVGTLATLAAGGGCLPCSAAIGLGVGAGMGWIFDRLDNRTPGR